jgi:hypothetical protein
MKKIINLVIGLCTLGLANSSRAEVQIVESLMQFQVNGAFVYRQGDRADWGTFYNPRLSVAGLGTTNFNPGAGDSLILDRVFVKSNHWNGGNAPDGGGTNDNWITAAPLFKYSITASGGADSWQTITTANTVSGNVQEWNIAGLNRNLLSGLSAGTYTFKYYFEVEYNFWNGITSTGGTGRTYDAAGIQAGAGNAPNLANASSTTFNVIPEPSSSLLMGLGLAGLAVLRRARKNS